MPIVLSLSSLRPTPSAPDLLFPSASDLWFRALPRVFLCRFTKPKSKSSWLIIKIL